MRYVRLYLRLGDQVYHDDRQEWGMGAVVEEMTSTVEGGTCLVRVLFEDGVQRTFNNDLDSDNCCYFMGMRRRASFNWEGETGPRRTRGRRRIARGGG